MQIAVTYDILPSDISNLLSTFIDGGIGREWWELVEVQVRRGAVQTSIHSDRPDRWVDARYGDDKTYTDPRHWRVVLTVHDHCVGDVCTDGKTWGWKGKGSKVEKQYVVTLDSLAKAANLAPSLFAEWIESGERNISTTFDAPAAESIMQLAAFGVEVYA